MEHRLDADFCWQVQLVGDGTDATDDAQGATILFRKFVKWPSLDRVLSVGFESQLYMLVWFEFHVPSVCSELFSEVR